MLKDHIINNRRRRTKKKVINVANSIKNKDIFNGNAYWEFKRKMKNPNQLKVGQ